MSRRGMTEREVFFCVRYVLKLKDAGMRKVMLLQLLHSKTPREIAKLLKIREEIVEKIGKKGAMLVKEMMYNDMMEQAKNPKIIVPGIVRPVMQGVQ